MDQSRGDYTSSIKNFLPPEKNLLQNLLYVVFSLSPWSIDAKMNFLSHNGTLRPNRHKQMGVHFRKCPGAIKLLEKISKPNPQLSELEKHLFWRKLLPMHHIGMLPQKRISNVRKRSKHGWKSPRPVLSRQTDLQLQNLYKRKQWQVFDADSDVTANFRPKFTK